MPDVNIDYKIFRETGCKLPNPENRSELVVSIKTIYPNTRGFQDDLYKELEIQILQDQKYDEIHCTHEDTIAKYDVSITTCNNNNTKLTRDNAPYTIILPYNNKEFLEHGETIYIFGKKIFITQLRTTSLSQDDEIIDIYQDIICPPTSLSKDDEILISIRELFVTQPHRNM